MAEYTRQGRHYKNGKLLNFYCNLTLNVSVSTSQSREGLVSGTNVSVSMKYVSCPSPGEASSYPIVTAEYNTQHAVAASLLLLAV